MVARAIAAELIGDQLLNGGSFIGALHQLKRSAASVRLGLFCRASWRGRQYGRRQRKRDAETERAAQQDKNQCAVEWALYLGAALCRKGNRGLVAFKPLPLSNQQGVCSLT